MRYGQTQNGFTLAELLVAVLLASLLLASMNGLVKLALGTDSYVEERNHLLRDARFALDRMVRTAGESRRLLLPLADNPATSWPENIREETVPASPPIGSSIKATAVLAVTLPISVDLDSDGLPDADDDKDGTIDEDLPSDAQHDFLAGIMLIDDDGDGLVDEGNSDSDDESATNNDDPINGFDDDADGGIDEDPASDNNGDGCPGICGVDDDSDGTIDNSSNEDDDEDGATFEDPYNPVVYYLNGSALMERMPVPWNEDGISTPDGPVDGRDFVSSVLAENVTRFRVERPVGPVGDQLVILTLELTGPSGQVVSLETQVRVGGAL
jgi:prepilin-type N-terminal cleavage/methylation domain-containing protein